MSRPSMSPAEGRLIAAALRADHDLRQRAMRGGALVEEDGFDRLGLADAIDEEAAKTDEEYIRILKLDLGEDTHARLAKVLDTRAREVLRVLQ